jgi:hypothetical protein
MNRRSPRVVFLSTSFAQVYSHSSLIECESEIGIESARFADKVRGELAALTSK